MSRVAKSPVSLPKGIEVAINGSDVKVKGAKGELTLTLNSLVEITKGETEITFKPVKESTQAWAQAGTARSLVNNMIKGVSAGFEKKLLLNGVGYRAQVKGKVLNLTLGFSHPIEYTMPEGIKVDSPTQTEVVISGVDKQLVGQVAAEVRAFRPPEPYKGKGVRYADEHVRRKEAKKK